MPTQSREMFVNLAVSDIPRTKAFWTKLGFEFNAQFSDEKALCMIVSDKGFVMHLQTEFFKTFTKREVSDTKRQTEALIALSCSSREEVDRIVKTAVDSGGSHAMPATDHGFMYSWSFYDPDEHHWEVMWMNPSHVQPT